MISSNQYGKKNLLVLFFFAAVCLALSLMPTFAMAGGIDAAKSGISESQKNIYMLLGAGAAVFLLIRGYMLKIGKIGWGDLFQSMITVAVVAGLPALAVWFWDIGGN